MDYGTRLIHASAISRFSSTGPNNESVEGTHMSKRIIATATGDALVCRRIPTFPDESFTRLVDLIQSCDVAFTNMEMVSV